MINPTDTAGGSFRDLPPSLKIRRRRCGIGCAVVLGTAVLSELAGFHRQGITMQVFLYVLVTWAVSMLVAWAARKLPEVLLLWLSTAVALAGSELLLRRTLYRQDTSNALFRFDEALGWRFIPGSSGMVVNSDYRTRLHMNRDGFRDREQTDAEKRNPTVIAVLGDSFVTNVGVEQSEVFTTLLDERWPGQVRVCNFGINGFGQVQELLLLDEILATQRPQWVLVVFYVRNDFDDNAGVIDHRLPRFKRPFGRMTAAGELEIVHEFSPPSMQVTGREAFSLETFLRESALHRLAREVFPDKDLHDLALAEQPPELRYCRRDLGSSEQHALAVTQELLHQIAEKCQKQAVHFGLLIAPTRWQVDERLWAELLARFELDPRDYERAGPQRMIAQYCAAQGYAFLDLLPVLEGEGGHGEIHYYPREQHWTALGNRRVAQATARWLEAQAAFGAMKSH